MFVFCHCSQISSSPVMLTTAPFFMQKCLIQRESSLTFITKFAHNSCRLGKAQYREILLPCATAYHQDRDLIMESLTLARDLFWNVYNIYLFMYVY